MKYRVFTFLFILFYSTQLFAQDLSINEFMSSNDTGIQDSDGDYSDWIEIYNISNESINLLNYTLSDDAEQTNKWAFPSIEIQPNGFLLLFASAKDSYDVSELHTNFKIKQSGEFLILSNPQSEIISLINPVSVATDHSYGSIIDGGDERLIFSNPSPNSSNATSTEVYYSHSSGFFQNDFELTLISSHENYDIRYTTNGEIPKANSNLYTQPILLSSAILTPNNFCNIPTTPLEGPWQLNDFIWEEPLHAYKANIIRYASFNETVRMSKVSSKTFFIDPNINDRYSFPLISVITDSLNLFQHDTGIYIPGVKFEENGWNWFPSGNYHERGVEWERDIHISYFETEGSLIFETDAGIRMRGYGSTAFAQKSFGVYFRKEYGLKKIEYPIFTNTNSDEYKRLVFRSSGNDFLYTHFRDALLQNLLRPMDLELQDFSPSVVFINGEYWGIHGIREKTDKYYFKYQYGIEEDNINILGVCGSLEEGSNVEFFVLSDFINLNDISLTENYNYVKSKLDIQNFIDYEIAEIYYANYDWPCNNYKIWKTNDADSKWRYLIYDLDLSFDYFDEASYNTPSLEHATNIGNSWPYCECSNIFFNKLLENDEFKEQFINRFAFHLNTTFNTKRIVDSINKYKEWFEPEMQEHIDRWSYPSDLNKWYDEIEKMVNFAKMRPCYMRENIMNFFNLTEFGFDCEGSAIHYLSKNKQIIVSPNPSNGKHISISFSNNERVKGTFEMMSLDGKIVATGIIHSNKEILNLSHLNNGVYILKINIKSNITHGKIVISH